MISIETSCTDSIPEGFNRSLLIHNIAQEVHLPRLSYSTIIDLLGITSRALVDQFPPFMHVLVTACA